jgi:hypothetical protein
VFRRVLLGAALALILATGASASTTLPSFYGCHDTGAVIRPKTIVLACNDGNFQITRLIWSRWANIAAVAKGAAHVNDCLPNCAAGKFHIYRGVHVVLSRPRSCSGHLRLFTRISVKFTKHKPDGVPRYSRQTIPLWPQPHCP